jgi:hypothetical protein
MKTHPHQDTDKNKTQGNDLPAIEWIAPVMRWRDPTKPGPLWDVKWEDPGDGEDPVKWDDLIAGKGWPLETKKDTKKNRTTYGKHK